MKRFIIYICKNYPIQAIDPRFQVDHVHPKRIQLLYEEYRRDPDIALFDAIIFTVLIRHRELKMFSDGNKKN